MRLSFGVTLVNENLSDAAENRTTVKEPVFLPTFFSIKWLPLN